MLERLPELRTLTFTRLLRDNLKGTDEQPEGDTKGEVLGNPKHKRFCDY